MGNLSVDKAPIAFVSNQSLASSFFSSFISTAGYSGVCFEAHWSGSAIGSLYVQGSGDGVNASNLDADPAILNNASDSWIADIIVSAIPFLRLSYVSSSGTGTLNVTISAKGK